MSVDCRRWFSFWLLVSASLFFSAAQLRADYYFGATGSNGVAGSLYLINPNTGAASLIGPLQDGSGNPYGVTGLAFQPSTQNLYGSTANASPINSGHLVKIDPSTGLVTDIGSFGLPSTLADITFEPTTGILYGLQAAGGGDHWLYTVSLSTGVATKVGIGTRPDFGGGGLASNSTGVLFAALDGVSSTYGHPTLRTLNKGNGTDTLVAFLTPTPAGAIDSMDFNSADVLYGFETDRSNPAHTQLITINTITGAVTVIGLSVDNADGLAILKTPADAYLVRYAANLSAGDSSIDLTNAGSVSGSEPVGNICANVYVFAADQQMIACCTCPLTPNHLKSLSVKNDLTSNTLTPGSVNEVTIELLATAAPVGTGTCNAGSLPGGFTAGGTFVAPLVPGLEAWGTTLHGAPGGGYGTTETAFSKAPLSNSELNKLNSYCGFIQSNGSGYGICSSCRTGALGASRQ